MSPESPWLADAWLARRRLPLLESGRGAVPAKLRCVLRLEKKGRAGKAVTVVAELPRNQAFLAGLAAELKRACGTGGTVADAAVEIQGDQRDRLRPLLAAKGWVVRG